MEFLNKIKVFKISVVRDISIIPCSCCKRGYPFLSNGTFETFKFTIAKIVFNRYLQLSLI